MRNTRMTNISRADEAECEEASGDRRSPAALGRLLDSDFKCRECDRAQTANEKTSKWRIRSKDVRSFRNDSDATEAAMIPGTTLIRKSQCQE